MANKTRTKKWRRICGTYWKHLSPRADQPKLLQLRHVLCRLRPTMEFETRCVWRVRWDTSADVKAKDCCLMAQKQRTNLFGGCQLWRNIMLVWLWIVHSQLQHTRDNDPHCESYVSQRCLHINTARIMYRYAWRRQHLTYCTHTLRFFKSALAATKAFTASSCPACAAKNRGEFWLLRKQ